MKNIEVRELRDITLVEIPENELANIDLQGEFYILIHTQQGKEIAERLFPKGKFEIGNCYTNEHCREWKEISALRTELQCQTLYSEDEINYLSSLLISAENDNDMEDFYSEMLECDIDVAEDEYNNIEQELSKIEQAMNIMLKINLDEM